MGVIRLDLAYDGTGFRGFAKQPRIRTIQGVLDAGVHAEGQVVSFEGDADPQRVQRSLNRMLAPEVVVRRARRVPPGFDARHSATSREYRYRIRTSDAPNPFTARYEWHRPGRYRLPDMRRGARLLIGEHDFASFGRRSKDGSSTRRNLRRLSVRRDGDILEVRAEADSFLHQMVRSLVGTLVEVGEGRIEADTLPAILKARSRNASGAVAPPDGLVLVAIRYGAIPGARVGSRLAGAKRRARGSERV